MDEELSPARRLLRWMPIVVLIAALYSGWIFYSRWNAEKEAQRNAAVREQERLRWQVEQNGGDTLKILSLYATNGAVRRGESVQICYGVANATSVAFYPPVADVWPSMSRCVDVTPKKSTTYTLIATDRAGHTQKAQLAIEVR